VRASRASGENGGRPVVVVVDRPLVVQSIPGEKINISSKRNVLLLLLHHDAPAAQQQPQPWSPAIRAQIDR